MTGTYDRRPWVGIARDDAREWLRDHRGAPLGDFDEWVVKTYEPYVLGGNGHVQGQPLTLKLQEILDQAHEGLLEAAVAEARQRAARAA